MIGQALLFLRDELNRHLAGSAGGEEDPVVFLDGYELNEPNFKQGAVTQLLFNLQEERQMRQADRYTRRVNQGAEPEVVLRTMPDIRLFMHVLFIARYKDYHRSWDLLSQIIQHFQSHPVYRRSEFDGMPGEVETLILELIPLDFSQQNDIWNALRVSHHPCIHYRVRLLVFRDQSAQVVETPRISGPPEVKFVPHPKAGSKPTS